MSAYSRRSEQSDPNNLTTWKFFIGESLESQLVDPFEVEMELDAARHLHAGDPVMWAFILNSIEKVRARHERRKT